MVDVPLTQGAAGILLLEDGTEFAGRLEGLTPSVGELVFTTNMTGYQEVLTDPSFASQIVVMTSPMIGNYGVAASDAQSSRPWVAGFVVRELRDSRGSWRAETSLPDYLRSHGIAVLHGVDTRAVTRHIRSLGAMRAVIVAADADRDAARARLEAEPAMLGRDLVSVVSTQAPYVVEPEAEAVAEIACLDLGVKRRSLDLLAAEGFRVRVLPGSSTVADVLSTNPAGLFVSNGPGDPEAVTGVGAVIREIAEAGLPVFGICLGCQLVARAFGGRTYKLPYGHRGGNHPVRDLETGRVEITSQNHGFAVVEQDAAVAGAPTLTITHRNLNDGTIEGVRHRDLPVFAVQYHPEAAPGPHDSRYLFRRFVEAMRATRSVPTG
ncbi:MAG: glutamine-hydrolyzing carbamoyl-phosphate synthase small subunit [Gemmatimonadota bacterium]|nr:glutamine-hydrolyzing carbamoyl-phosphate synthase small subunit [Gemmatimonadota bacterium]MDH3426863.1 glutamine-hydrolyzing carbamoyl-phosphate synthase small subunit [Gemmatimonadota bacterium]